VWVTFVFLPWLSPSLAAGPVIGAIRVKGQSRIEVSAVIEKMSQKVGQPIHYDAISADIRSIYELGVFEAIEIHEEPGEKGKVNLLVVVKERPVISEVKFDGLDNLEEDDFKDAMSVKKYMVYNPSLVAEAAEKIRGVYEDKGYYLAQVNFEAQPVPDNPSEVVLVYKVQENDKIRVKKINFLGNKVYSDADLKGILQTKEGSPLGFITDAGNFREQVFDRDTQIINYWYYNHGYVQVEVGKPQVSVSPDKRWIYITIPIKEGDQFNIGSINYSGELLFTEDELRNELKISSGDTFSSDALREQVLSYTAKYGDLGYAFANVVPQHAIHPDTKLIDITFTIEKGEKVRIGRIMMSGNTRTRDKVLRRELLIHEGELYNETNLRKSRESVERLGFFEKGVAFNKTVRPGTKDTLDITIVVKERHTGTLTIGAGYSSADSFIANAQVAEENFLGRGQRLAFYGLYSKNASRFNLSFDEPYFWDTVWSVGGDLYRASRDVRTGIASGVTVISYDELKFGGDVRVGHPIAEYVRGYITYKAEDVRIQNPFNDAVLDLSKNEGLTSSLGATIARDTRDNRFETSKGDYESASVEVAGLGGNKFFAKTDVNFRFFHPIWWKFVFKSNLEYGYLAALGESYLPVNERFVLGGVYSLRGYQPLSVGPMVCAQGTRIEASSTNPNRTLSDALAEGGTPQGPCAGAGPGYYPFVVGGRHKILLNAEIEFPIFEAVGIKGVFFFDAGNSFDSLGGVSNRQDIGHPFNEGPAILSDWGFGFRWFSPIGPLRFEFGFPFSSALDTNKGAVFNFMIGPSF
jgi:outer membrane protein insertion porin family